MGRRQWTLKIIGGGHEGWKYQKNVFTRRLGNGKVKNLSSKERWPMCFWKHISRRWLKTLTLNNVCFIEFEEQLSPNLELYPTLYSMPLKMEIFN